MVDNFVSVSLNGIEILALTDLIRENYTTLNAFGTSNAALFNPGQNTLQFVASDSSGLRAFGASVEVTAAPVPLPAVLALLLASLSGFAWIRRKNRGRSASALA